MRLSTIKLAGFKSFVDPTVLHLPSDLVGIVGPNGCGKSNIIDAVRWVMGESSARSLRGETMSDVIFNGSASRKPVGQASIELVFDNSQGRLGGPPGPVTGKSPSGGWWAATASPATFSTARAAAAATSPTFFWAPAWGRAATPSSNRA